MSKENTRKSPYQFQRSISKMLNDSDNNDKSPFRKIPNVDGAINGVSKSDIDFLKNLSDNILSIKGSEKDFSCYDEDSFKRTGRRVSSETCDSFSLESIEDLKIEDDKYSLRKEPRRMMMMDSIRPHNNSYERNSKRKIGKHVTLNNNNNNDIPKQLLLKAYNKDVIFSPPSTPSTPSTINVSTSAGKDFHGAEHCSQLQVYHDNSVCHTIGSSSSSSSGSIDTETDNEWKRIDSVLSHIDPFFLAEYLSERIKNKDIHALNHLSPLLPKTKFTGETSHCVRCHSDYDDEHGNMFCFLYHKENDVEMISQDADCALFQCERCLAVFKLHGEFEYTKYNASKCGHCFTGTHTSMLEDVVYEPEGVAKRCVDYGCFVFFV